MEDRVKGKETLCVHLPDSIFFSPHFFSPIRSYRKKVLQLNKNEYNDKRRDTMVITSATVGIGAAYVVGTVLGGIMMWRHMRKTEVEIIAYTIDMMIQSKFIKTKLDANSEVVLMSYDSDEYKEEK